MVPFFLAIRIADKEQAMKLRDVEVEAVLLLPAETQVHIPPSGDFFNFGMDQLLYRPGIRNFRHGGRHFASCQNSRVFFFYLNWGGGYQISRIWQWQNNGNYISLCNMGRKSDGISGPSPIMTVFRDGL